jgi:hypothetical protein
VRFPAEERGRAIGIEGQAFVVQGEPLRDRERLVWTLEVRRW